MANLDVSGLWRINQDNGAGVDVNIHHMHPNGSFALNANQTTADVAGTGNGSADSDQIALRIRWANGTEGAYLGVLNLERVFHGTTFDVKNPGSTANWSSSRTF